MDQPSPQSSPFVADCSQVPRNHVRDLVQAIERRASLASPPPQAQRTSSQGAEPEEIIEAAKRQKMMQTFPLFDGGFEEAHRGLLANVFSFVGPGHYRFIAAVDSHLKQSYEAFLDREGKAHETERKFYVCLKAKKCLHIMFAECNDKDQRHAVVSVIKYGQFDLLRLIHDVHGIQRSELFCEIAAAGNHLNILKFLRAIKCPWDASTIAAAEKHGHLEVLKWCRKNGCPDDSVESWYDAAGWDPLWKW